MRPIPIILLAALSWACSPGHPEIHEWRGAERSGIYPGNGLLKEWPEDGPQELWYLEGIGSGFGSPVPDGQGFLYITGAIDSTAYIFCISREGAIIWQTPLGKEWVRSHPGSRSAPTVVDDLLLAGSGMGDLYCLDKATGTVIWSKSLEKDFAGSLPYHGHSESAAVDGGRVFWTAGGKEYNVLALDLRSGDILWSNPGHGERSAYHSPRVIRHGGRSILVTFSAYHLMGLDAESGELLWSHEQDNTPLEKREPGMGDTHANTVLYEDGCMYYAAGDGNCGVKLALSEDGSQIREIWRNSAFDSFMGGIVKLGDHLYGMSSAGKQLVSVDAGTGRITDSLAAGVGALIAADRMLYYYNYRGELKLVSCERGRLREVSSFRITRGSGEHFSHPVIHEGILYLRHGDVLMAFDLRIPE